MEFIKALKSSISEQVEVDANKRKLGPTNSGKDQRVLNRDRKVELTEDDLHQTEFQKWEFLSSTNRGSKVGAKNQDLHGCSTMKRAAQSITNLINAGKAKMMRIASDK